MIQLEKQECCGCSACMNACPNGSISMETDAEGFKYPIVNKDTCVNCGLCMQACPSGHAVVGAEPKVLGATNRNMDERVQSSSGGIFVLLAKWILNQKGWVFGAAIDASNEVIHIGIDKEEDLFRLQGSKYVQSDIGFSYAQVKKLLAVGTYVLFTGTPCQVYGLKKYLGKEYETLFCVDFICHGVPSPSVWKQYVEYRERQAGSNIKHISFRDKQYGWKRFSMSILFENGRLYTKKAGKDPFLTSFFSDACLRPSCYECQFKGQNRMSDITLADFWKVEDHCPELDDNKGTSLLLVNSNKGQQMIERISKDMISVEVPFSIVAKTNSAYQCSVKKPQFRNDFMNNVTNRNFERVSKRYCYIGIGKRIRNKLIRTLRRK